MKEEVVLRFVVQRPKKRDALDVVPMEVRDKHMRRHRSSVELATKLVTEHAESGAAVENVQLVTEPHFDAGGIPAVAQVFGLRSRGRAANSPEFHTHASPIKRLNHLPSHRYPAASYGSNG